MITSANILAAVPAPCRTDQVLGGSPHIDVRYGWEETGADVADFTTGELGPTYRFDRDGYEARLAEAKAENVAPLLALLPAGDDAAGWSALAAGLRAEPFKAVHWHAESLEHALEVAVRAMDMSEEASRIAWKLIGWLEDVHFGHVGPHVMPDYSCTASIFHGDGRVEW